MLVGLATASSRVPGTHSKSTTGKPFHSAKPDTSGALFSVTGAKAPGSGVASSTHRVGVGVEVGVGVGVGVAVAVLVAAMYSWPATVLVAVDVAVGLGEVVTV